MHDDLTKQSN